VISMIEGSVWGGACDLAMTCDLLVGTPAASFAITPAKIGIAYNSAGLNHFIGVLPAHIIKEMLFTGDPISAQEARNLGLLNKLVEADQLEETTMALARTIASRAPLVVQLLKKELQRLTSGKTLSPDEFEELQGLRRRIYRSNDFKRGCRPFSRNVTPPLPENKVSLPSFYPKEQIYVCARKQTLGRHHRHRFYPRSERPLLYHDAGGSRGPDY